MASLNWFFNFCIHIEPTVADIFLGNNEPKMAIHIVWIIFNFNFQKVEPKEADVFVICEHPTTHMSQTWLMQNLLELMEPIFPFISSAMESMWSLPLHSWRNSQLLWAVSNQWLPAGLFQSTLQKSCANASKPAYAQLQLLFLCCSQKSWSHRHQICCPLHFPCKPHRLWSKCHTKSWLFCKSEGCPHCAKGVLPLSSMVFQQAWHLPLQHPKQMHLGFSPFPTPRWPLPNTNFVQRLWYFECHLQFWLALCFSFPCKNKVGCNHASPASHGNVTSNDVFWSFSKTIGSIGPSNLQQHALSVQVELCHAKKLVTNLETKPRPKTGLSPECEHLQAHTLFWQNVPAQNTVSTIHLQLHWSFHGLCAWATSCCPK